MRVNTISFNYDTKNIYNLPLNLRYNYEREINIPEYDFIKKRNCPICYSSDNVNDELIIKASFEDEKNIFNGKYLYIRGLAYDEEKNILGTTKTHSVGFINGYSQGGSINFGLSSNKISDTSLGKFDCCYKWQYKENEDGEWKNFDVTEHTVYIIPHTSLSKLWTTDSLSSNYVPWADALEYVCSELGSSKVSEDIISDDDISESVAKWINGGYFSYDGDSSYSTFDDSVASARIPIFNAKKFLTDFSLACSCNKLIVNCNDCACINIFFLSLLGITGEVSYLSSNVNFVGGFKCNEVIVIGDTKWHIPFYNESYAGIFRYHAVCSCTAGKLITDSCLKIDFGENPWSVGDPSGVSKDGKVACKTVFADPATTPQNPPKVPYVSSFYRERLCDLTTLASDLCKVISSTENFEFTTALCTFRMKEKTLTNKYLKKYAESLLNKNKLGIHEKIYAVGDISLDGELKLFISFLNDEKNFCVITCENEDYKNISAELYLCRSHKIALCCGERLINDNSRFFNGAEEFKDVCDTALKSSSEKIIIAIKENAAVKIKAKNDSGKLSEFTKKFLSLFK